MLLVERLEGLLSRKFLYAIMVIVMSYVLVLTGRVEPKEFMDFATVIGGIYVIGNVGTQIVNAVENRGEEP